MWKPLEQMERVATGPLPELDAFLPRWVEHLERQSPSESEWDDDRDRWLRESHWQGEFLRWLGTGTPSASTVVQRAKKAIEHCPGQAGRQLGLLHLLRGDVQAASQVLARARGLGWSAEGHPGHLLFPAFAGLLAQGTETQLVVRLFADLRYVSRDPSDMDREEDDGANPRLAAPSVTALIARSRDAARIDAKGPRRHAQRDAGRRQEARRGHPGQQATPSLRSRSDSRRVLP